MIISIDPGGVRIGFCMFIYNEKRRKADLRLKETVDITGLYERLNLLDGLTPPGTKHVFVVENFRVDSKVRGVMFQWDEMLTSQVIGAVKYAAYRLNESKVVMQEPGNVLTEARKWCDYPMPKNPRGHVEDSTSAYCHGVAFMVKAQMINSVKDVIKFGQEPIG